MMKFVLEEIAIELQAFLAFDENRYFEEDFHDLFRTFESPVWYTDPAKPKTQENEKKEIAWKLLDGALLSESLAFMNELRDWLPESRAECNQWIWDHDGHPPQSYSMQVFGDTSPTMLSLERIKDEAPRYAKLLPELPRLLHASLQARPESPALLALLEEQRRANKLLLALLLGVVGFVVGTALFTLVLRWHLY